VPQPVTIRYSILTKMLLITLLPATVLIFSISYFFHYQARASLEDEMGRRLVGIARSAALQVDANLVQRFQPGDENGRPYQAMAAQLSRLAEANDVDRIYVVNLDQSILFDTEPGSRIGQQMYRLAGDRSEMKMISQKQAVASTMFKAADGRLYKAGYAPLVVGDEVVGLIGVDAGVAFFDRLHETRGKVFYISMFGLLLFAVVGVMFARRLVKPITSLATSARRIGEGDFETPIQKQSRDEMGLLAGTMNQMRLRIIERDRYLQMLQRGIAHEVRNPLGGMELYCDILADELNDRSDSLEHVNKIRREVKGLDAVVNEFLDFTRETLPDVRPVNVHEFFTEFMMVYAGMCEAQNITLRQSIPDDIGRVLFDPDLIRRALHNLLLNAIQAMSEGGELTLRVFGDGEDLQVEIKDTGGGIPEEIKDTIFSPFVTNKDSGTGLGLPFALKIVEGHGGTIDIASQPGVGTTVIVSLPQAIMEELQ